MDYNAATARFLEKLAYYCSEYEIDFSIIDLQKPFPINQLVNQYHFVNRLIDEVDTELNYQMSEFQCSQAVVYIYERAPHFQQAIDEYNSTHGTALTLRR